MSGSDVRGSAGSLTGGSTGTVPVSGRRECSLKHHLLEVKNLTKDYRSRQRHPKRGHDALRALDDITVGVCQGEILGIVGESGSGKSTLARVLLALEEPTSGEVWFDGLRVTGKRPAALRDFRRQVQVVFQDPAGSLDPRMRVGEIIAEPLSALRIAGDHDQRVAQLLESVGLPADIRRSYPHQFSGGQRQRIAIARALAPRPRVLVADEPVSALDVSVRAQVLNLLGNLIDEFGLTMVFISHDMAVVRHLCDRVAVLYRGRIVEIGTPGELYSAPEHPYTQTLISSIPTLGKALPRSPFRARAGGRSAEGCIFVKDCPQAYELCSMENPPLVKDPSSSTHFVACHMAPPLSRHLQEMPRATK